jgi:hypothetical protein
VKRLTQSTLDNITKSVGVHFRTFGGGQDDRWDPNPIALAMKDKPLVFAAGVDVRKVVEFIAQELKD